MLSSFRAATFGLLVWVDSSFFRSRLAGNETATCALTETTRAYLGAVESARGESNTGVPF